MSNQTLPSLPPKGTPFFRMQRVETTPAPVLLTGEGKPVSIKYGSRMDTTIIYACKCLCWKIFQIVVAISDDVKFSTDSYFLMICYFQVSFLRFLGNHQGKHNPNARQLTYNKFDSEASALRNTLLEVQLPAPQDVGNPSQGLRFSLQKKGFSSTLALLTGASLPQTKRALNGNTLSK